MKCPINSQPQQPQVGKPQGSKVARQVIEFYDGLRKRGGVLNATNEIEATLAREFGLLVNSAAHIPSLTKYSKIENVLATALGFKSTVLSAVDLAMTEAGSTRALLQSKARESTKLLQLAALNKSIPKINELMGELQNALPMLDKTDIQTFLHDHILIGQFPKLQNIYDSPVVRAQLAQRYQEHVGRLTAAGATPEAIKRLDILAGEISQSFDNARSVAGKYGLDVKALINGGYFPIQAQETIKRLLEGAAETGRSNKSKEVFDTAKMLSSNRFSSMPIVLDQAKAAKVLGLTEPELADLLTTPGGISKHLRDTFKPEQLETLYNNGTLTQIPALSDELTTFFAEELDLPIKGLAEAIILDPVQAIKKYNQELTKAVQNSAMVQTALEDGIKYGWVVDESQIRTLANAKDYVKVGSDKLYQELFRSDNLREAIANMYIHRTVNDQLLALTEANTSFTTMGLIGSGLQTFLKFTGFTKRTMIAGAGLPYLGRVFLQNAVSLNAATRFNGMSQYAQGIAEVFQATAKGGSEALPTEFFAKIGGTDFSLRDLFDTTFIRRASDNVSVAGEKFDAGDAKDKFMGFFHKDSRDRFFKHMEVYHERYGSPVTGKVQAYAEMFAEVMNSGSKLAYEQLAKGNQLLDFAARWTAVRTLAKDPGLAGRKEWKNVQELLQYTDEYFNVNEDVGKVGSTVGQFLVPFASFALVAPGQSLRHVIRHPWRYARAMSLYAQVNSSSDLTDAELADWQKDSYPLFLGKDPETGKRWAINPGTVDSFLDTKTWAVENFEKIARAAGAPVGSVKEQINQSIDPKSDFYSGLEDLFSRTYLSAPLGVLALGIDPTTKEKLPDVPQQDSLIGFGMDRRTRTAIVAALPVLRTLDRNLPAFIVGESSVQDPITLENIRPGKAGWMGNVPTSGGKSKPKDISEAGVAGWIIDSGGLTISEIDPNRNLINNYRDFGERAKELGAAVNAIDMKLNSQPADDSTDSLREERVRLLQLKGLLEYNQIIVDMLAIRKGYTMPQTLEYVRRSITSATDIPQEAKLEFMKKQQGVK